MCDNALFQLLGQGIACDAIGDAVDEAQNQWVIGLADTMKTLMTFWLDVDSPNLDSSPGTAIDIIKQLTLPLVAFGAIIGICVAAGRMIVSGDSGKNILRGLLLMMLVSVGGASITAGMVAGFDALGQYILDTGFDGQSVGERLLAFAADPGGLGVAVLLIISILGILASLIQIVIVFVRGVILALLVAMLPIAAGATITQTGMDWLKKLVGWIFAFAVYKLTASIIYATAFAMIGTAENGDQTLLGLSMIILAVVALPALLRLLPPAIATSGGGGGGALAAVGGALATGSLMMSGRGSAAKNATAGAGSGSQRPGLKNLAETSPTGAAPAGGGASSAGGSGGSGGTSAGGGGSASGASSPGGTPGVGARKTSGNGSGGGGQTTDTGGQTSGASSDSGSSKGDNDTAAAGSGGGSTAGTAPGQGSGTGSHRAGLRQLQSAASPAAPDQPGAPSASGAAAAGRATGAGRASAQRVAQAGQIAATGSSKATKSVVGQQDEDQT